ncbi:MAG TPA: SDR family NAD(P)-dependent oxidoreductase [Casimicrobiaceae bacterium]|nr:SDR family NAD(P)-dependent oxidoreductase [Casimicrobiaceae bacterium]
MHAAIVTGVSRGLGESMAAALLAEGYTVLGVGRRSSARLAGERYRFASFDLAEAEKTRGVLEAPFRALAAEKPESICLVNNAAVAGPVGVLGRLQDAASLGSLEVNLIAPLVLCNLFCAVFADESLSRRVINVSSGAAQSALPGEGLYCVAKAGLEMLTRVLAAEQKAPGFRAINVRPGIIDTEMQLFARSQSPDALPCVDMFREFHSQGRLVPPDVVAEKIVAKLVLADVEHGRTYTYQEL